MNDRRFMSAAEASGLEAALPPGLTADMRDVALCLFEALVLTDPRAGAPQPDPAWQGQLGTWTTQVLMQMQHLANEKGGAAIYFAKGVAMHLSSRDREMCGKFRGNNYRDLAREYGLTEMRVRQIVDAWQRERFLARQSSLPGIY